jgi:hypothetical protein
MPVRLEAVSFDAHDPGVLAAFWAGVLGREIVGESGGTLLPGGDTQVGLRFIAAATERSGPNRLHLHLTSSTLDDQRRTVEVGLFWRDALGWPLVWDRDGETAVQSPWGGTKVSWGGPPLASKNGRNRQRLDLAAPDLAAEVGRLVALGATELGGRDGGVELADPDGNEFSVHPR